MNPFVCLLLQVFFFCFPYFCTGFSGGGGSAGMMRAWTCHGQNQRELVECLVQAGIVQTPAVAAVMTAVDRANYVPKKPYLDSPQLIGGGQTISAPHMHAYALEEMYPFVKDKPSVRLLDVGAGSGYLSACLARWFQAKPSASTSSSSTTTTTTTSTTTTTTTTSATTSTIPRSILGTPQLPPTTRVVGLEVLSSLVDLSRRNLQKADGDLLDSGILQIQQGDGWKGVRSLGPYDAIHVGAAADGMPYELISQLKVGGVMIVPVGSQQETQELYKVERISCQDPQGGYVEGEYRMTSLLQVRYVPLVHPNDS